MLISTVTGKVSRGVLLDQVEQKVPGDGAQAQ